MRASVLVGSLACAAALLGAPATASAEPARAVLAYEVAEGVPGCPTRGELVDAVAARLGYDPFAASGSPRGAEPRPLVVTIARGGGRDGLVGTLVLGATGRREVRSTSCRELVDTLAVAAAIGLDPESFERPAVAPPAPEPPPTPPPPPEAAAPPPRPLEPPPPAPSTSRVALWLGPLGSVGDTPSPTVGLALGAALRLGPRFGVGLEASTTWPSAVRVGTGGRGRAEAFVASLAGLGCLHVAVAFGCARASAGVLAASGSEVSAPEDAASPWAALGLRVGAHLPLGRVAFVGLHADADAPLVRVALRVDGRELWQASPVAGRVAVVGGVVFR